MKIFETDKVVILSYPPFAGGKFLSNCIALSKGACPQNPQAAEYLLINAEDYDYRHTCVLKTLPPKNQLIQWKHFEFGDRQLYGDVMDHWWNGISAAPNHLTERLARSTMRFFMVDHSMDPKNLVQVWPNAVVVRLVNFCRFQTLAVTKKHAGGISDMTTINGNFCQEKYDLLRGMDWPSWREFECHGYDVRRLCGLDPAIVQEIGTFYPLHHVKNKVILFDVDSSYLDRNRFMSAVATLYQDLDLDDFQPDLVGVFYDRYMELHS